MQLLAVLDRPWFKDLGIRTVLDIGANSGQFAATITAALPDAQVVSFEPIPQCFATLTRRMSYSKNFAAHRVALGDSCGTIDFHMNAFTPSSSCLPMAQSHVNAFPNTRDTQTIEVPIDRLDAVADRLGIVPRVLVKIDVQGYEGPVLSGGERTIREAAAVIIETSFTTLYEGQLLFDPVYRLLTEWGFRYVGSVEQHHRPSDELPLFEDSLFLSRKTLP
jgi:FkbM family methyltransferase